MKYQESSAGQIRLSFTAVNLRDEVIPSEMRLIPLRTFSRVGLVRVVVQGYRGIDHSSFAGRRLPSCSMGSLPQAVLQQFGLKYGQFGRSLEHSPLGRTLLSYQDWLKRPSLAAHRRTVPGLGTARNTSSTRFPSQGRMTRRSSGQNCWPERDPASAVTR